MIRFRASWLLVLLAGCGAPRARIAVERLPGTRPELVVLRCQALGLKKPHYDWTFGASVHQVGWGAPRDEAALFVSLDKGPPALLSVSCRASEEKEQGGRSVDAATSLAPIVFKSATAPKRIGELVVVEGSGFGGKPLDGDALWLIPPRGDRLALDHGCKGAAWTDAKITACLPPQPQPPGRYELRLESGGRLAATAINLGPVK
jgi:hypothetical protein